MHPVEMPRFKKRPFKAITKRQSVDADESGVGFWRIYLSSVQKIVCNFWRTGRPHKLTPRGDYLMKKKVCIYNQRETDCTDVTCIWICTRQSLCCPKTEIWTYRQQAGALKKQALNTQLKDMVLAVRVYSADQGWLSKTTTFKYTIKTYFHV